MIHLHSIHAGSSRRPRRRFQRKSCAEACTEPVEVMAQGAIEEMLEAGGMELGS